MPRRCSETRVVKEGIWNRREKNRERKLKKKQSRMRSMLSGELGKFGLDQQKLWYILVLFLSLKSTNIYRLAQSQMRQQKLEDAVHEAQKPLARHFDDEDLDRMLREQERDGDPMAAMLRRKKERSTTTKGTDWCRCGSIFSKNTSDTL